MLGLGCLKAQQIKIEFKMLTMMVMMMMMRFVINCAWYD